MFREKDREEKGRGGHGRRSGKGMDKVEAKARKSSVLKLMECLLIHRERTISHGWEFQSHRQGT